MKRLACLLVLATFAAIAPGYGQGSADDAVNQMGTIRRPTPKPAASASAAAAATGPLEIALYKDEAGKNAATTFTPSETVYLKCKNVTLKKGDTMGAIWYSGASGKGKKLFGSEKPVSDTGVYAPSYNLAAAKGGTPAGAYHVDLSVDSKVVKSVVYTVK